MKVDVYSTAGALLHSYASGTNPSNLQLEQITAGPDGNMWFDTFSGDNVVMRRGQQPDRAHHAGGNAHHLRDSQRERAALRHHDRPRRQPISPNRA